MWILKQPPFTMLPCQLIHCYSVALRSQIKSKVAHLSFIRVQVTNANRSQQEKQAKIRQIMSKSTSHSSPNGRIGIKSMLGQHLLGVIRVGPGQADTFI